jgi:hypothetical protein
LEKSRSVIGINLKRSPLCSPKQQSKNGAVPVFVLYSPRCREIATEVIS